MATDMAQHNAIMEQFSSIAGNFSFDDEQQVKLVSDNKSTLYVCSISI